MKKSSQKKVLFLEDEEALGLIYKKKLEQAGYRVCYSRSVEEAEEELKKCTPDFCVIDHGIKGKVKTGLDLVSEIKKKFPKAKIIMLSNYNESQMEVAALAAGADAYLLKIDTPPKILMEFMEHSLR
ncbi:response regulator [Candidatus Peregrinibacteria bacterium]|nr:response regulator [Candidatus Peregrinibacteria bacterium]